MPDWCPDCGEEFARVNQHLAMSDCEGQGAKTPIECEHCGDEFREYRYRVESDRERDGTKFCSERCHNASMREGRLVECDWCGEDTYKPPSKLVGNDRYFCDRQCSSAWRSEAFTGDGGPAWEGGKVPITCEICGSIREVKPSEAGDSKYCSRECQADAKRAEVVTRSCAACGEDVTRKEYRFRGEVAVCGPGCWSDHLSETRRGESNPAWKGGQNIVRRVRAELGDKSWNRLASECREKASHTCEWCGDEPDSRKLSVHHIIPLATGGTHGDWNLMALCGSCHRKIETKTEEFTDAHIFA